MSKKWLRPFYVLAALAYLFLGSSYTLAAVTGDDLKSIINNTVYYDSSSACDIETATNLSGSDNQEKAFHYFVQKNLTAEQSAGIVGNLMQESGVNPASVQQNGPGHGIAQWSEPGRWDVLLHFAAQQNRNPLDLGLQLDFIWHEMNDIAPWDATLPALKASTTVDQATIAFEQNYEKAGTPNMDNRIKYAKAILRLYGSSANLAAADVSSVSNCSDITPVGQDTHYVDGFVVYSQYDPAWVNKPYGKGTIGECGCGPSAMAMIITNLTKQRITPVDTANYAASHGQQNPAPGLCGSLWTIGPVLAQHWGLKSKLIGVNLDKISQTLQSGGLVITSGAGPKPFTSGGHFIVIRGITASGKLKVGDSAHNDTNTIEYNPNQLLPYMNDGSTYAIYK